MSTNVSLRTSDGRIINGMNFTVDATHVTTDMNKLVAGMQGGPSMGVYHILTANGWEYIPAGNIDSVLSVKPNQAT